MKRREPGGGKEGGTKDLFHRGGREKNVKRRGKGGTGGKLNTECIEKRESTTRAELGRG